MCSGKGTFPEWKRHQQTFTFPGFFFLSRLLMAILRWIFRQQLMFCSRLMKMYQSCICYSVGWGLLKASCYLVQSLIVHDSINSTILSHFRNFPFWNMFLESTPTWKNAWKNSKITQRRYLEHQKIKLNVYLLLKLICKFRANSASSLIIAPVHFCIQALLLSLWNNIKQIYFFQHHHAGY